MTGGSNRTVPSPDDVARGLERAGCSLEPDSSYLVMLSGGPDSSFLLWALVRLGTKVVAFHLDHALRPGSEADARAARALAEELSVPIEVVHRKPEVRPGASFESAARLIRYEEAERVAQRTGCKWILTAHTADDQIETFFINLARGAGLDGLKGIPRRSGKVVRPMLHLWKRDVRQACEAAGIAFVEDPTNLDVSLLRNRVRLQAIPALEQVLGEGFKESLLRQTELLRDDAEFLNALAAKEIETHASRIGTHPVLVADASWFFGLPLPVARRVVRICFENLAGSPPPPARLVAGALEVSKTGGAADLGEGFVFAREGKRVVVRPGHLTPPEPAQGEIPGEIEAPGFGVTISAQCIAVSPPDLPRVLAQLDPNEVVVSERMAGEVVVRAPLPGERFSPLGLKGSKPLADFLAEKGLCKTERLFAPVLCKPDGTVVWVVGHRISNEAAVREGDTAALHLVATAVERSESAPGGKGSHKPIA